ncbi:hypothetical protein [Nocardia kruczakiae]|uniref:hypothetical protein n=1 Tax=Nocardia kruczakiae TaxID=261477 RepID=UPI0007A4AC5E|nr:hypothetical protein [Nocardia kruczakiae]
MDVDEAVRGARLLAADIEGSLGFEARVTTEYTEDWQRFDEQTGRAAPGAWVSIAVPQVGTTAALDPTEPGSTTAEGFAMELVRILQDDIQIHLREPWPKDPLAGGRALEPTEWGWQSRIDPHHLVPYGRLSAETAG